MEPESALSRLEDLNAQSAWLRTLARSLVRDADAAEDLVQEAWIRALDTDERKRPAIRGALRPWLAGVVRNLAKERWRGDGRRARREEAAGAASAERGELPSSEQILERAELQGQLVDELARLSEPARGTLLLHFHEGLPAAEIARRRGVPSATVRSQIHRGLAELRARLDAGEGGRAAWMTALAPLAALAPTEPARAVPAAGLGWFFAGGFAKVAAGLLVALALLVGALMELFPEGGWPGGDAITETWAELEPIDEPAPIEPASVASGRPKATEPENGAGTEGERRALAATAIDGRVYDAGTGTPLAEAVVRLFEGERMREEVRSGADGRFAFRPAGTDARLEVAIATDEVPGGPWRAELARVPAAAGLEFGLVRVPTAPIRVRVVDQASGQVVPAFHVTLEGTGGLFEGKTDEAGAFESPPAAAGDYSVVLLEPGLPNMREDRIEHEPGRAHRVHELAVRVGPTYFLDVDLPEGLGPDGLVARLAFGDDDPLFAIHTPFALAAAELRAPRIEGGPLWVRFDPEETINAGPAPWWLDVASRDGLWRGRASIESIRGLHPGLVPVVLEPGAAVRGVVFDARGEPLVDERVTARSADSSRSVTTLTDEEGRFAFLAMEEGEVEIAVHAPGHARRVKSVTALAHEVVVLELRLEVPEAAGVVRGTVESRTGRYDRPVDVQLHTRPHSSRELSARVTWEPEGPEGRLVGSFAFKAVEPLDAAGGHYRLAVDRPDAFEWEGLERIVLPGDEGLHLLVRDDVETYALALDVRDAASGEALASYQAIYGVVGASIHMRPEIRTGSVLLREVPVEGELLLVVAVPGYATARVGAEVTERMRGEEGELRTARIELARGWGTRLLVADPEGAPLAGVRVLLDGRPVGRTGVDGELDVRLEERPERIALEREGYRMLPGHDVREDGRFEVSWWDELRVVLEAVD